MKLCRGVRPPRQLGCGIWCQYFAGHQPGQVSKGLCCLGLSEPLSEGEGREQLLFTCHPVVLGLVVQHLWGLRSASFNRVTLSETLNLSKPSFPICLKRIIVPASHLS